MVLLRVSYKVRVHHIREFDEVFHRRILPLIRKHDLQLTGVWRTFVGDAGEYMELWQFNSVVEFESRWRSLMADPDLQEVFLKTGPMVEGENFSLFEPAFEVD
jgi:hypothetical protein